MQLYRSILIRPHVDENFTFTNNRFELKIYLGRPCIVKFDIARLYKNDRARHDQIAREWTKKYAKNNEPKTLQHLATETVYDHRDNLPWQRLPKNLIYNIMGTEIDEDLDDGDKAASHCVVKYFL